MGFKGYVLRRVLSGIPVFIGLSILIFTLARVLPGDPARLALGPRASDEAVQSLRDHMGLDEPIVVQYLNYMAGLVQGDMGISLTTNRNVAADLLYFFPATFELITVGMLIAVLFGVPLGVIAGKHKDKFGDNASRLFAFFGVSMPAFWAAILLQLVLAFYLGLLPATGRIGTAPPRVTGLMIIDSILATDPAALRSALAHLVLPAFVLALAPMADIARMTRSSFIEEFNKEYVHSLHSSGIPGQLIAYKYVLKASFAATLTIIALDYGFLIGSAFLIEIVFAWPGMARYGVNAILENDINAIIGVTLVVGVVFIVANIVVDVLYGYFDPRVRYGGEDE
ncbi:ABC transporter permease [Natrononativus amylolyticus]|uniref:ABC transporter permease n=1 Tax=Natrononativus amylolyticus TaxID=2963434 RepID=UPI0020CE40FB|nr:ABC transporter permease [Natrononativus amylolyticus]